MNEPGTKWRYENYQCQNCEEVDRGKFFEDEQARQPINCWSCKQKDTMYLVKLNPEAAAVIN